MWEKLLLMMIPKMMDVITPTLRDAMREMLNNLQEKAEATPNPWDDMFVWALRLVLNGR